MSLSACITLQPFPPTPHPPSESLQLKVVTGHAPSFQTSKATHRNDGLEPLASGWGGYQWLDMVTCWVDYENGGFDELSDIELKK